MLNYFYMTATGKFQGLDSDGVAGQFTNMLGQPVTMGFWMIVVVIAGVFVCSRGLQNGLEKVTKVMMISLLVIMVVLAINSFTMDGAKEGLKFYLIPDYERDRYYFYHYRCYEPGILYSQPWYRCYGYLRKLHRKRSCTAW